MANFKGRMREAEKQERIRKAAPDLLDLLKESQHRIGGSWRKRRDAIIDKVEGREDE